MSDNHGSGPTDGSQQDSATAASAPTPAVEIIKVPANGGEEAEVSFGRETAPSPKKGDKEEEEGEEDDENVSDDDDDSADVSDDDDDSADVSDDDDDSAVEDEHEDQGNMCKWTTLEHKGPVFAPPYKPLPEDIHFYYDGNQMKLEPETEEVATFYAKMLDDDYTPKEAFNDYFLEEWQEVMSKQEKEKLIDMKKCDFTKMNKYFKNMSKEEKSKEEEVSAEYGFCTIDGHREEIVKFMIEPPGLFRGRGDHPKQGMLKRRVMPEDVIINCSRDSKIPIAPDGHKWKKVCHNKRVTWLSRWRENINGKYKYVMLSPASKLKGKIERQKYETARCLHQCVNKIRAQYREDWKSREMRVCQRSVALYFIDELAFRPGNKKEKGETADTVGCCTLRVEHLTLHEKDGNQFVVDFDFPDKCGNPYTNSIPVEEPVFENLKLFMKEKKPDDVVFDKLNAALLRKHLQELMEGLTAKVFRTYNASRTLLEQLNSLTKPEDSECDKILSYNIANCAVAVLLNHQRAVPMDLDKSIENLHNKITLKKDKIQQLRKGIHGVEEDYKATKTAKAKTQVSVRQLEDGIAKLSLKETVRKENKGIGLDTSKIYYLDPRITIAWCRTYGVHIEKIYAKNLRNRFQWAFDTTKEFNFFEDPGLDKEVGTTS